ncbi:MAG: HEAT repeat domain-containing protein [bacterium]
MEWYERLDGWNKINEGDLVTIALFKFDMAKSTQLGKQLGAEENRDCLKKYHDLVEYILTGFNIAPQPFEFQKDGATVYFLGENAVSEAVRAGKKLLSEIRRTLEYEVHIRIGIGVDDVYFKKRLGEISSHQFDLGGHSEKVCPIDSLVLTEEAYLDLDRLDKGLASEFGFLGTTLEDKSPLFVYPKTRQINKPAEFFKPEDDPYCIKARLINYYNTPSFCQFRFVGIRQFEKVGLALEIRKAYVLLKARAWKEREEIDESRKMKDEREREERERRPFLSEKTYRETPIPLDGLLKKDKNIILLGDPGSGKTTFLRWLSLMFIDGVRNIKRHLGIEESLIPLFISVGRFFNLRSENPNLGLLNLLSLYFCPYGCEGLEKMLEPRLNDGQVIFLFDGLDELPSANEREIARNLVELYTSQYSKNRFIITSRIVGYPGLSIPNSREYCLEGLDEDEATKLAFAFYFSLAIKDEEKKPRAKELAEEKSHILISSLKERENLLAFLQNPLLLTLSAICHTNLGKLPKYRVRLYEVATQTLVDAWANARRPESITEREHIDYEAEGLRVLPAIALWMHQEKPAGLVREDELIEKIKALLGKGEFDAKEFMRRLEAAGSLLINRGENQYGFIHQTFQEYLVAKQMVKSVKDSWEDYISEFLYNPRYEEIWRLIAGEIGIIEGSGEKASLYIKKIYEDTDDINAQILKKNLLLSAKALSDTVSYDEELNNGIVSDLFNACIKDEPPPPREQLFLAIRQLKGREEGERLCGLLVDRLKDFDRDVRSAAAEAIGNLGDKSALPQLIPLLSDAVGYVRSASAEAIGMLGDKSALPQLIPLLSDANWFVRSAAVEAIGKLGDKSALPQLIPLLSDAEWDVVRSAAAEAIGKLGDKSVLPKLIPLLNDADGYVCSAAARAIGELGDKSVLPKLILLLKDAKWDVRSAAARAIGNVRDKSVLPQLIPLLSDADGYVRSAAARAIGKLGDKSALPQLIPLLSDDEWYVRSAAAEAIGKLGDKSALPQLIPLLSDADGYVCSAAARAIGELGDKSVLPKLILLLKDAKWDVRSAAARAIGKLGDKSALPQLIPLLNDAKWDVRSAAAEAIWNLSLV